MKKACKRGLALLLTLVMVFGITIGSNLTADAAGNPYPQYNYYNSASDYQIACTWYAWKQANERLGLELPKWGNGGDWYNNASGYSKGGTARANSIACWAATSQNPWGHVAYVTGVNSNGSINIVEGGSGWPGNNHGVCSRTVSPGQYWPDQGFIYLQPTDTTPPTISNVQVTNRTIDGYTVTCTVSDNVGVVNAQFPTWTAYNGQDDLIWHTGTISGNTASFRVLRSAHNNEMESYITDIYVWDAAGNGGTYKSVWVNMNAYTVSYNANGGSGAPGSQTKLHDVNLTISTTKPTRSGYTFKNWNTKSDGTGTSYSAGGTYKTNAAATLYAQWTKNATLVSLTIQTLPTKTTYDVGEKFSASGLTLTATYSDGSTQTVSKGYACTGFSSDAAGTKTVTVTWGGLSTAFTVTVVGADVTITDFRQERTEHYKTSVRFYAGTQKAPANATVHWFVNGTDVGTGSEYTVRQPKEDYTVQTKLLDESGQIVAESEIETVHIRRDLWSRLRALLLWLFSVDYVIVQREEGPFSMPVENA